MSNITTILALVPINKEGILMAYHPTEYINLGQCSEEQFKKTTEISQKAIRVATEIDSVLYQNQIMLRQIFDGMAYAGLFVNEGIDCTPFLRPYFEKFITEHQSKQTMWAKWKMKQSHKRQILSAKIKSFFLSSGAKYFPKFIMWLKNKFGG
jgi:hypothetical protein